MKQLMCPEDGRPCTCVRPYPKEGVLLRTGVNVDTSRCPREPRLVTSTKKRSRRSAR